MAIKICKVDDVAAGKAIRVRIDDVPIAIVKTQDGDIKAISDTCSHGEISLSEGFVEDSTIECWAHGAKFDLDTGKPLSLPAFEPVPIYEVIIENDDVYLEYETE
jgi:3-phenylpropionate/trans-cinnamate dioxygenase ferredoxin subunit